MNHERRKELLEQYKQRTVVGGIYRIRNTVTGHSYVNFDDDLTGAENRHRFSVTTNTCILPEMREDWLAYGAASFTFERLEELEKKPEQSRAEFLADLETLLELWREKNPADDSQKK